MPALVVPNAAQMRLIWSLSGQLYALNVLGVVNAGSVAITQALTNTIGAAIKTGFSTSALLAFTNTAVALANIGLRDIRTANSAEFIDTGAAVSGSQSGDLLPPQTALCVTLRTAFAGRSFRGRCYIPGAGELGNDTLGTSNNVSVHVAFLTAVKAALVSSSLDLGVISRPRPGAVPPYAGFITPVTSIVVRDAVWDTQRRRAIPGI